MHTIYQAQKCRDMFNVAFGPIWHAAGSELGEVLVVVINDNELVTIHPWYML